MAKEAVKLEGFAEMASRMQKAARKAGDFTASGVRMAGEAIMTDVRASRSGKGVPKKTGNLAASGRVKGPDAGGFVTLSFGGAAAPYALRQHEDWDYHHRLGEARYLVRGAERFAASGPSRGALKDMLDEVEKALKGKGS